MTDVVTDSPPGAARFRSALWYAIDVLTPPLSILAVGFLGLRLGQELAKYLARERLLDQSAVLFPFLGLEIRRGFLLTSISVGGAGILIKSTMEFASLVPTMIMPAWYAVRERLAFKAVTWQELAVSLVTLTWNQWRTLAALLGATASLGIAILLWEPDQRDVVTASVIGNEPVRLKVNKQSFDLYQKPLAADVGRSAFLVLFEEETAIEKRPFVEGLKFSGAKATEDALTTLASRLAYCNRGGRRAILLVQGYASSSGRDEDNLELAHARANTVRVFLEGRAAPKKDPDGTPLGSTIVQVQRWENAEEMKSLRGFQDVAVNPTTGVSEYSKYRGQLNRRAEIIVENAGACTKPDP
jgi:hypothetical protein